MILPQTNVCAAHKPAVFTRDPGKRGTTVVVQHPDERVARSFRAVDREAALCAASLIRDAYNRGVHDGRAAGPSARPWEGPEGYLFIRDLVRILTCQEVETAHVLHALSCPWKFQAEVAAFRAAQRAGMSLAQSVAAAEEAHNRA